MTTIFALCHELPLDAGAPPRRLKLIGYGTTVAVDGRRFVVDGLAHALAIIAATPRLPAPIDYDHAIDLAARNGGEAPAAAWITGMEAAADGIYANVEWTERGGSRVAAKEYRFISPAMSHDKATGKVTAILRAALTNNPALDLPALAHAHPHAHPDPETSMTKEQRDALLKALGLKPDADDTALCAAAELAGTAHKALLAVAVKAGLKAEAKPAEIETALCAQLDKASGTTTQLATLAGQVLELNSQMAALQAGSAKLTAEQRVEQAIKDGKVVPATRDAALALCQADPAAFEAFLAKAPLIVGGGTVVPAGAPAKAEGGLDAADLALCAALGIEPEAYKKEVVR